VSAPIAFASYCQFDDENDEGFVEHFCDRLQNEVRALEGKNLFEIFRDKSTRNGIRWGEAWQSRVDRGLDESTFLIVIVTPSFLESEQCRREVLRFDEIERSRGRNDLILPVYYINDNRIPFEGDPSNDVDRVAKIISSHQWIEWRPLRHRSWSDSGVKSAKTKAAESLRASIREGESRTKLGAGGGGWAAVDHSDWIVDEKHYSSVSEVLKQCKPGDRIIVRPGTHEDAALILNNPVDIVGHGGRSAVRLRLTGRDGLTVAATSFQLRGVTIEHVAGGDGAALVLEEGRGRIEDCVIQTNGLSCIRVLPGAAPTVKDCKLRGGRYGVVVVGAGATTIDHCDILDNSCAGIACFTGASPTVCRCTIAAAGHAFWLHSGAAGTYRDNDLSRSRRGAWNMASDVKCQREKNVEQ